MTFTFSEDQTRALSRIRSWLDTDDQILTFGGLAGTGKTSLIKEVTRTIEREVDVVAYTGKAVSVLRGKGVNAFTLHSLIYLVAGEDDEGDPIFKSRTFVDSQLVIVDEASMINRTMHEDLERLVPKILYVGDHGQLQPIGYDPGLMDDPDIRLEQIHRQAAQSPILQYAHHLRINGDPFDWPKPNPDGEVRILNRWPDDLHEYDVVLVGYNATRHYLNKVIRERRNYRGVVPNEGETLICLQNHRRLGLFNGLQIQVVKVEQVDDSSARVWWLDDMDRMRETPIYLPQLGSSEKHQRDEKVRDAYGLFDWGYAMTTHKSQGSEWDRVCVVEGIAGSWDASRWRYTAVTRAAKQVCYVVEKRQLPWEPVKKGRRPRLKRRGR